MSSALLDPSESARRVRPLRHGSKAQQEAVRAHFAALHAQWCADWLPAGADVPREADVVVREADAEPVPEDAACWSFADESVVVPGYAAIHAVGRALFGTDLKTAAPERGGHPIAEGVARAAWDDWLQRLVASPAFAEVELREATALCDGAATEGNPWSGALWLHWRWCGGLWRLGLPHAVVAALVGKTTGASPVRSISGATVVRLDRALTNERVDLRVMLDGVELSLGQLQALRPGDVIPLAHRLDAPLKVTVADGAPLCDGWLGQRHGRIAIEMAAPEGLSSNNHSGKDKSK